MWAKSIGLVLLLGVFGCTNQGDDEDTDVVPVGPVLSHVAPTTPIQEGQALTLSVEATDDEGVAGVTLYYRTKGLSSWEVAYMVAGAEDQWSVDLADADVVSPGLQYYFKGIDDSSFQALTLLPNTAPSEPFTVDVEVIGATLPFFADFEGATNGLVKELGWKSTATGFEGYEFALTQSESHSESTSLWHRRGPEGLAPFKDWLISPALSFDDTENIQVTWWEKGRYTESASHSLWISTTSDDPRQEGAFEKVADLMAPEDEWSRSNLVDLSAWSGERVVYLAWYYEGQNADDWYVDDVDVRVLQPDIALVDLAWTEVEPGGQTTVTLTLGNHSPMTAVDLTISLDVDASEGSSDGVETVATLAEGEQTELSFVVDVAPEHHDDAYLPFIVDVTDGESMWAFDRRLIVGDPTVANIEFYLFGQSSVTGWLGVGDVDSPDLYFVAFNEVLNGEESHTFSVDLTEYSDLLPATAADRWWLKVESGDWGFIETFELVTGDSVEAATVPHYFYETYPEWTFVPEPPNPIVIESRWIPVVLAPGDSGEWSLSLSNYGEATSGETSVTVSSSDPSLQFTSPTNFVVAPSGWLRNQTVEVNATFDIAPTKKDSVPILIEIDVVDDVESFERTTSVKVPWPVLEVTRVLIDDATDGDDDGVLDPFETASLEIYLSNSGGLNTFSLVNCTLSQVGGVAVANLSSTTANFGVLTVGETENEDGFELEVTAGALNDDVQFGLSCSDGTEVYEAPFTLVLGIPPWNTLSTTRDSGADAIGGYDMDLLSGRYRSDGTTLDISLTSSTEFDSSTVFVEAWASSPGGDYGWYQFVVQGGTAKVRGYDGTFHDLSTPVVSFPNKYEVIMSVDLASLGLLQDTISLGFASGFCGGSSYYCDHYPDGWGDPYNAGFFTASWFDLTW